MKTLAAGLQEHLETGATTLCWCWKVVRRDGEVMGFTDHDGVVSFDGVSFEALSGFTASEVRSSLGLSVDNLDVEGALSSDLITETDIAAGRYDGAEVEIIRVNWQNVSQRVLVRKGNLGDITRGETSFTAEVRGLAHQLQQPQGRMFQRSCDAMLGDSRCGVNTVSAAYSKNANVLSVFDANTIFVDSLSAYDESWFDRGSLSFTSGLNSGLSFPVRSHRIVSGEFQISTWEPITFGVSVSDTVVLVAGCDKRFSTCLAKFSNGVNFRGFPHMPGNDFMIQYPNKGQEGLDGSTRYDKF